ncbi:MAG: hypothetical protein JRH17_22125 [Deltaproteobacteria bacterium]|nr:hypothetical protein [Deltaproteobacteria bacterium]
MFELEIDSRTTRPLTSHFAHKGFSRARYLANDDLLLCGPRGDDAAKRDGGRWHTELWYLASDLSAPAIPLDEHCFEGPAVSRRSMRIAWTLSDYPDSVVFGRSEIWLGEIVDEGSGPKLVQRRKILDRGDFYYLAFLETQDFNPSDEGELIFTAYAYKGGEVMGIDIETGKIRNYSQNWAYDEAEGVFPDGRFVAVEREPETYTAVPGGRIDIWRTALDGSGHTEQLTHFTDFKGFGANNPVVSPNGRFIAFQLREAGGEHGNGHGIFLLDLYAWAIARDASSGVDARPGNGDPLRAADTQDDED